MAYASAFSVCNLQGTTKPGIRKPVEPAQLLLDADHLRVRAPKQGEVTWKETLKREWPVTRGQKQFTNICGNMERDRLMQPSRRRAV
jgi:hypothetical protein